MSVPWFVFRLSNADLAIKTMKRLEIRYLYPYKTVRRPRKPDLIVPILGYYVLVTFDPDEPVRLKFESGEKFVPWPVLQDLPGVSRIFHNGARPYAIRKALSSEISEGVDKPWVSEYRKGDEVPILEGPFASFPALIERAENGDVEAWVSIFGRSSLQTFREEALGPPPSRPVLSSDS